MTLLRDLGICVAIFLFILQTRAISQKTILASSFGASKFNETIKIGAPISFQLGDSYFTYGNTIANSWNMFVEWVLDRGGIELNGLRYSVSVHYIEDFSDKSHVQDICDYLTNSTDAVDFMFGPYSGGLTEVCSDITEQKKMMLLSGGTSVSDIFWGTKHMFGTLPGDFEYAQTAFGALDSLGAANVAVVRDIDYPTCANTSMFASANTYDIEFVGAYDVDPNSPTYSTDVTTVLTQLAAMGVESVFGCSYKKLCTELPASAKSLNYNLAAVVFTSCLMDTSIAASVDEETSPSAYTYGVAPWAPTDKIRGAYTNWTAQEFSDRYAAMYNAVPPYHAASAFAAGICLVAAIEETQSTNSAVLTATLEANFYNTFYANITFSSLHQAKFDMLVSQILPSTDQDNVTSWSLQIVQPDAIADRDAVYPAPTWAQRECDTSTDYCDSHGTCDTSGVCTCEEGYYGGVNSASCDTLCDGEVNDNVCREAKTLRIGGMVAYQYAEGNEYQSSMRLAVQLINNKTDGWFDDTTSQIYFDMMLNNSACNGDTALEVLLYQMGWSDTNWGHSLDGLIGAECSSGSKTTAAYGGPQSLPQLSFKSTTTVLSDKDEYPYFARTCASDAAQGPSLSTLLMQIGVSPYAAMVSTTDDYASSMSKSFSSSYEDSGNTLLANIVYSVDDEVIDYDAMVDALAVSGAPAIVLVLYPEETSKILNAASKHPVLSTDAVIWISVDSWSDLELSNNTVIPRGVIGLTSYQANNSHTIKYRQLWQSLDPTEYIDTDGDRSTFAAYSLHIVDAVTALAMAYQKAFDDDTGLTGSLLRQYVYTALTRDIAFEGVSGYIDFDAEGDLSDPKYRIVNYDSQKWRGRGTATSSSADISEEFIWPDGTMAYYSSKYSSQLVPYCPAGQEPVLGSTGTYVCSMCSVGYYNPTPNSASCKACPEGAECNDVGIVIPCISPGYWRAEPPPEDIGNFHKYRVYSCDYPDSCKGGCVLNATCSSDRQQDSPTCAVCMEGYYNSDGKCYKCGAVQGRAAWVLVVLYGFFTLLFMAAVGGVLWASVTFSMSSFRVKSSLRVVDKASVRDGSRPQTLSNRVSMGIEKIAAILQNRKNVKVGKKLIRGTAMTAKLVISFVQVVSGSFSTINIAWPQHSDHMFAFLNVNPLNSLQSTYLCIKSDSQEPYFMGLMIYFLSPFAFLVVLMVMANIVAMLATRKYIKLYDDQQRSSRDMSRSSGVFAMSTYDRSSSTDPTDRVVERLDWAVWNTCGKLYLWFCLIAYPSVSASMLGVFNCRNLGTTGVFLRADYSVDCEELSYQNYVAIGAIGTVLYPIGIPLLFYVVIRHRMHPLLLNPAKLLYENFAVEWMYYEVYDLVRKLLLTSIMPFVAPPDSPSQCLYLLLVDMVALVVLAYSRPYANANDDFLSGVLVSIECGLFLLALVIISGISEEAGYDELALYNITFVVLVTSLAVVVPYTLAMKFTFFKSKWDMMTSKLNSLASKAGISLPDLHRLDAKARMDEDMEVLQRLSIGASGAAGEISLFRKDNYGNDDDDDGDHKYASRDADARGVVFATTEGVVQTHSPFFIPPPHVDNETNCSQEDLPKAVVDSEDTEGDVRLSELAGGRLTHTERSTGGGGMRVSFAPSMRGGVDMDDTCPENDSNL